MLKKPENKDKHGREIWIIVQISCPCLFFNYSLFKLRII